MNVASGTPQTQRSSEFRLYLQEELVARCNRNARYSLRSFARALEIPISSLSGILNGSRPLTEKMKIRICRALGVPPEDVARFRTGEPSSHAAGAEAFTLKQIALDTYALISDWHHFAILELTHTRFFRPEPRWIARRLGLTLSEVNVAVGRLKRVGLLEVRDGKWLDASSEAILSNIHADVTSSASRKLQKQVLEKALSAIDDISLQLRDNTSMTMAMSPADLPEAKRRIARFRRELCRFLTENPNPTEVYHLGIALYPVTRIEPKGDLP